MMFRMPWKWLFEGFARIFFCDPWQVELLEMINEQVVLNLRLSPDSPDVHERLTFLGCFLEAVGENPPDELVGLSREVNQAYHKARPQMEQTLGRC